MPKIELSPREALVLIDLLLRFRDEERLEISHEADKQILWDLCALLESQVPELLDPSYRELLTEARESVMRGDDVD